MESLIRSPRIPCAVYTVGTSVHGTRADEVSMRLRVGSGEDERTSARLRHENVRVRVCVDAWSNTAGGMSRLVHTFRRSTEDLSRASQEMLHAFHSLMSSTWAAIAPSPMLDGNEASYAALCKEPLRLGRISASFAV